MASKPAKNLEASLDCQLDGRRVSVAASHGVIVVDVETLAAAKEMIRICRVLGSIRSAITHTNRALTTISHRLEIHVGGATIVAMGHGTNSGVLRLAGLRQIRFWPLRLLRRRLAS